MGFDGFLVNCRVLGLFEEQRTKHEGDQRDNCWEDQIGVDISSTNDEVSRNQRQEAVEVTIADVVGRASPDFYVHVC